MENDWTMTTLKDTFIQSATEKQRTAEPNGRRKRDTLGIT